MKTRMLVLILTLALLALSACAPVKAAQPTVQPRATEVATSHLTVTKGTQLLANEAPGRAVVQADDPDLFADEESGGTVIQAGYPELLTDEEPDGAVVQAGHPEVLAVTHELAGNPFHALLGPIRTADGSSVHPCSGEAPLLCVYQGRTLLGTVELATSPLASDLGFQKVLEDAGIPLGSADYTDFGNRPLVRTALAAHAANDLADLAQDRGAIYADKGYTFTPVAPEEIHIGQLPAVTYGFTGYDRDGHVFERRLTYAALDNNTLYLFGMSYADGLPESFVSDRDLVRFEPYLRQILAHLRLPVGEDWRSPGAELIREEALLVVQRPDDSIQYVTLDGLSAVLVAEAPGSLLPAGYSGVPLGGTPMMDGPTVYVRQLWGGLYALDLIMGQLYPLDFVPPHSPVAVRPLTEWLPPEGAPISLAWGELSEGYTATARLYLSSPDGSQVVQALEETYEGSELPAEFVPWRWREDFQLYYTMQPVGAMAGFPPFVSAANLWLWDPRSGSSVELVSNEVTGGKLCLDAIYIDDRRVAHHCDEGGLTVLDLETGKTTPVSLPDEVTGDMQLGAAHFSPNGSRIAFAATNGGYHGPMEGTRGYIAVSDNLSLSGSSHVIVTSQPGEWFTVLGWLSDDRLVLQSYSADPSGRRLPAVWTVRADGSRLVKLAEGTFLSGRWYMAFF